MANLDDLSVAAFCRLGALTRCPRMSFGLLGGREDVGRGRIVIMIEEVQKDEASQFIYGLKIKVIPTSKPSKSQPNAPSIDRQPRL